MKWRGVFGVFSDHRIPIKLKRKFYKTAIRLAMPYGVDFWGVKQQNVHKMSVIK